MPTNFIFLLEGKILNLIVYFMSYYLYYICKYNLFKIILFQNIFFIYYFLIFFGDALRALLLLGIPRYFTHFFVCTQV